MTIILDKPETKEITESPKFRDSKGRYVKGHPLHGPGRPKGTKYETNIKNWSKLIKPAHIQKVYYALLSAAIGGDTKAIAIFLDRTLGKVKDELNVTQTITTVESPESIRQELIERIAEMGDN
jgi:hypothetical protein